MIKLKGISDIQFFAKGKRGHIYTGFLEKNRKKIKVAIKRQSPTTGSPGSIRPCQRSVRSRKDP
jgi:hypothetical protein